MEPFDSTDPAGTSTRTRTRSRVNPDIWKALAAIALTIIAICAIIAVVTLGQIRERTEELYQVTAKPHCYLSPNDPRRREIERAWGSEPTSEGTCDVEAARPKD